MTRDAHLPSLDIARGCSISNEAVLTVDGATATAMWREAIGLAVDLQPWVGCEAEGGQRLRDLLQAAAAVGRLLPNRIQEAAGQFGKSGNQDGAMLIQGLMPPSEVEAVVPTSPEFPADIPAARAAGVMAVALSAQFGPPISYKTNPAGPASRIIFSLAPLGQTTRPLSSTVGLGWHTEVGSTPMRPDMLGLFCIRGSPDAVTGIIPAHKVIEQLDEKDVEQLSRFAFYLPDGLVPGSEERPLPVIANLEGRDYLALDWSSGNTELWTRAFNSQDEGTRAALRSLKRVLQSVTPTFHRLEPGQMLAIDNTGLHSRTTFDSEIGRSRWLLRTFIGGDRHNAQENPFIHPRPWRQ